MAKHLRINAKQAGLYTFTTLLLVSAGTTAQPSPGQESPNTTSKTVPFYSSPFYSRQMLIAPNNHLERIPKCYIVAGLRTGGPGHVEYIDTSGQVISALSNPSLPKATVLQVPKH